MKSWLKYTLSIVVGGLICFGITYLMHDDKPIKFVSMALIFQESDLKKANEKKLSAFEEESNAQLLKLDEEIKQKEIEGAAASEIAYLRTQLQDTREKLSEEYQNRSQKYQEEVWGVINRSVERYGKEHHYKFILGATGNGALMYADESEDITKEIIAYINHHQ